MQLEFPAVQVREGRRCRRFSSSTECWTCQLFHREWYAQCQPVHKTVKTPQVQFFGRLWTRPSLCNDRCQGWYCSRCRCLQVLDQVVNFPFVAKRQILMLQFSEDHGDSPDAVHRHGGGRSCSCAVTSGFKLSAVTVEVSQILSSTEFEGVWRTPSTMANICWLLRTKGGGDAGESDSQVSCRPY